MSGSYTESTTNLDQTLKLITDNHTKLQESISNVTSKVEALNVRNSDLDAKIKHLSEKLVNDMSNSTSTINSNPAQSYSPVEAINEYLDRERRKCNLIIYNLQESTASSYTNRTSDDKKAFTHLLSSEFKLENIELLKCIRLGKPVDNKHRPLLISLSDIATKNNILSKATKLRKSTQYKDVYITPDLTKTERVVAKDLRDELKRRRASGETNLVIRRGKIVERRQPDVTDDNMDT